MTFSMGRHFKIHVFGESHGECIGVSIEGCPAGLELDYKIIEDELARRRPGLYHTSSSRDETDQFDVKTGVVDGVTTGGPIMMVIQNRDSQSDAYERMKNTPRPGHADFTAFYKYNGFNDYRGGGFFSGRMTAVYVLAGAVAKQILSIRNISVLAHTVQVGNIALEQNPTDDELARCKHSNSTGCIDTNVSRLMEEEILRARSEGDSVGGIVECRVLNLPIGVGEPLFDSIESRISHAMFSIPGVKGIEFGAGFKAASMNGSDHNDQVEYTSNGLVWRSNNAGGILGGLSTGAPIVFRAAFKPTPSISKPQTTIDLAEIKTTELRVTGRHDPCIVPRAVPVVENLTAFVMVDLLMLHDVSISSSVLP